MRRLTQVPEEVLEVMESAVINSNLLVIPKQLDRKLYLAVNKVLEGLGGKWDKRAKAHSFPTDPTDALNAVLNAGEIEYALKNPHDFFETPSWLAERMIEAVGVSGLLCLEPSAGKGGLARPVTQAGGHVVCLEINPERASFMQRTEKLVCYCTAFEEWNPADSIRPFDRVLMNPPFSHSLDARHILRAYDMLRPGGLLVSVAGAGVTFRKEKVYQQVRELASGIEELPKDTFKKAGTSVNTVLVLMEK